MWDNPRAMNLLANLLFVVAALMAVGAGVYALARSAAFPLRVIQIDGELSRVQRAEIVEALQGRLSGTFFTADLTLVRELFETVPWVRKAEVRRAWPGKLQVRIEEHVALARWGRTEDRQWVNKFGEVFNAQADDRQLRELPRFSGPEGSAAEVLRAYGDFKTLLAPIGFSPSQVVLSERRAWQMRLDSGLVVQLGRDLAKDEVHERLARFVDVYPRALGGLNRRLDYVDLRYPNGFVLRVPGMQTQDAVKPAPKV
jgi:cell division protein FtsQ